MNGCLDVGGISLIQRQARSAQHAGATSLVGISQHAQAYEQHLANERIAHLPKQWHQLEGSVMDALREMASSLDEVIWLVSAQHIMTPKVLKSLHDSARKLGMGIKNAEGQWLAAQVRKDALRKFEDIEQVDAFLDALLQDNLIECEVCDAAELIQVSSKQDAIEARRRLFKTLRKPFGRQTDGVTAYLLNRPVSLFFSRFLIHTPLTPNMVTTFNILLGIFGGVLIWNGEPWKMALGAFLMQVVSIFDGIDGELARMKLLMSKHGEWYDSIGDDIIKMSMFVSLGHACSVIWQSDLFLLMTAIGFAWTLMVTSSWYSEIHKTGKGSLNNAEWWWEKEGFPDGPLRTFLRCWGYLLKRDTYTFLLVLLVIFGFPALSVSLMFLGINIIFFATFGQKIVALFKSKPETENPVRV